MKGHRYKQRGWFNEPHRHALAARGIKTAYNKHTYFTRKPSAKKKKKQEIVPVTVEKLEPGHIYPVPPDKVQEIIARQDPEHIKGIKGIEFANPVGEQKDAWAQYVRSRKVIKIFSQPYENGLIDGQPADQVYNYIVDYVIPHEIGHHRALEVEKITDKHLPMAEARADAHVVGMSPRDKDVKMFLRKPPSV